MSLKPPGPLGARQAADGRRRGTHRHIRVRVTAGQCGLSLVETLIAALVFGIGLAGIAGLLVLGLRVQRDAAQESGAALLLADIGEEIRALTGSEAATLAALDGADPAASCRERPADCDRETAAALAAARWREHAQRVLGPSAVAEVERLEDGAAGYRVQLRWRSGRVDSRSAVARIEP